MSLYIFPTSTKLSPGNICLSFRLEHLEIIAPLYYPLKSNFSHIQRMLYYCLLDYSEIKLVPKMINCFDIVSALFLLSKKCMHIEQAWICYNHGLCQFQLKLVNSAIAFGSACTLRNCKLTLKVN